MAALELTVNATQAKLNASAEKARLELSQAMEQGDIDAIVESLQTLQSALQSSQLLSSMIERPNDGTPTPESETTS
jgi:hypothetical protein